MTSVFMYIRSCRLLKQYSVLPLYSQCLPLTLRHFHTPFTTGYEPRALAFTRCIPRCAHIPLRTL